MSSSDRPISLFFLFRRPLVFSNPLLLPFPIPLNPDESPIDRSIPFLSYPYVWGCGIHGEGRSPIHPKIHVQRDIPSTPHVEWEKRRWEPHPPVPKGKKGRNRKERQRRKNGFDRIRTRPRKWERMPRRIRHPTSATKTNEPHVLDGDRYEHDEDFRRCLLYGWIRNTMRLKPVPRCFHPRTTMSSKRDCSPPFVGTNLASNDTSRRIHRRHLAPHRAPSSARVFLLPPRPPRFPSHPLVDRPRVSGGRPCVAEDGLHGPPRLEWLRITVHNSACAWRTRAHEPQVRSVAGAPTRKWSGLARHPRTWA